MAAGDIDTYGPYNVNDLDTIAFDLSGAVVVADTLQTWTAGNQVWFVVVKAA